VPSEDFYEVLLIPRILRGLGLHRLSARYIEHLDRRLEHLNVLTGDEWCEKLSRQGLLIRTELPYATRRAASIWELIATFTGGIAYFVARGKTTPRKIQQSTGLVSPDRGWIGTICFAVLSPLILLSAIQRNKPPYAGRFVVATKEAQS
jgi:hypothetical protein